MAGFWDRTALMEREWRLKTFCDGLRGKMGNFENGFWVKGWFRVLGRDGE